jgi:hypothetical protein
VRAKQELLIANNSDIYEVELDDKTLNVDNLHYDSTSQVAIGNEIAQSIYNTVNGLIK